MRNMNELATEVSENQRLSETSVSPVAIALVYRYFRFVPNCLLSQAAASAWGMVRWLTL